MSAAEFRQGIVWIATAKHISDSQDEELEQKLKQKQLEKLKSERKKRKPRLQ